MEVEVRLSSLSTICLHVPVFRSHLTLDPLSVFLTPLLHSASAGRFQFSSTNQRRCPKATPAPFTPEHPPLLPPPVSRHLRCASWEMLTWLDTCKALAGPTTYPPLPNAETGNLMLACSAVLQCVTGAKWVRVLVSVENTAQKRSGDSVRKEK